MKQGRFSNEQIVRILRETDQDSVATLEAGMHDYIRYYNHERIKLGLQGLSPVEYRLRNTG